MENTKYKDALLGGLVNNPVFVLVIGMCPVIAQSNSFKNAFALGCATAIVLILANVIISIVRNFIPNDVRIPAYITIIATFTTIVILIVQSYMYDLYIAIGPFLSLVAVNCIVMARAETFSSKNNPLATFVDSFSMSIGFVVGISILGIVRELLVNAGFAIFNNVAGGFIALAFLIVLYNFLFDYIKKNFNTRKKFSI
ncbi:MAG: electron transport complex subunit RsxE [Firmicutes bacterium]|nr:electron transport complex subunit RsxE [Bacillota bacterium]